MWWTWVILRVMILPSSGQNMQHEKARRSGAVVNGSAKCVMKDMRCLTHDCIVRKVKVKDKTLTRRSMSDFWPKCKAALLRWLAGTGCCAQHSDIQSVSQWASQEEDLFSIT